MRNIKNIKKISSKKGLPSNNQGSDGDLSLNITNGGIGLFGKIGAKWYKFGSAQEISAQGKVNKKNKLLKQDLAIKSLDVDRTVNVGRTAITTNPNRIYSTNNTDIDNLYISSKVFDVVSSNTESKIYIGDVSLQPTWGTTGSTIKLENGDNGADLKILGAGSTSGNNSGGDTVLSSGTKAPGGSGSHGSITLGAGDSGTSSAAALNVNATSTVLSGTLTINTINTDTAGDNYLVEVSGVVKKRTPAEVLSDIGITFGIANTNAVKIDAADVADDEYARFTANGLESRTLGEIKTDIGTGNSALVPAAGSSGHFLAHNGAFAQVAYSNLSGTPTIPANYVTDDADDTMAGTLTIDKNSTATSSGIIIGQTIDLDHTGITGAGQTIGSFGLIINADDSSITHVGAHSITGLQINAISNTHGVGSTLGMLIDADGGDNNTGLKINTAGTHIILESNADTGDYFSIATTTHGATTIATVDDDATAGHLTIQPDGKFLMEMNSQDGGDDGWAITNNGNNAVTVKSEEGAENYFTIYETPGSTPEDYFQIETTNNAQTAIRTIDVAGNDGHLSIYPDGQLTFRPKGGIINLIDGTNASDSGQILIGSDGDLTIKTIDAAAANAHLKFEPDGSFLIKETASAGGNVANYGQLWVKNDTPNNLYFTDDSGQDVAITNNGSLAGGGGSSGLNSIVAAMVFG